MIGLRAIVGALITAAALAPLSCGNAEERAVRDAFRDLRAAHLSGDAAAVCDLLSHAARRELGEMGHGEPSDCALDLHRNLALGSLSARDRARPRIRSVTIEGDAAMIVAILGGTTPVVVHFLKQDGEWRLAQLFGQSAPPPPDLR